ncbi:MAG: cyclic nucleotide-binding domain-containing protein [Rhodothermales bacterium]|nr:cyclic nucleotide-binding domain-containing protein [Rhodothermales bacterium]
MTTSMDAAQLGKFSPFNTLESANLDDLLGSIEILKAAQGQVLFEKGDSGKRSIYLLSGTLSLRNDDQVLGTIAGGTDEARNPIAPTLPRQLSAVAVDDVQYFSIDSELLDVTLTLDHTGTYEVVDFSSDLNAGEGDWMSALLRTKTFQQIPPQNLQMIFMRLHRVDYKAGHVVIRQGSKGDDFYIVRSGRCKVTRETPGNGENIDLAELGVGDSFGEEALLSDEARNATITMLTDGTLMHLAREDFQSLLNEPLIVSLNHDEADEAVSHGGKWLDVRVPSEYRASSKANATNLPLYMLRHKLDVLDRRTPYVVYCDTGRRSSAAAFILKQRGFETAVLEGGLNRSGL